MPFKTFTIFNLLLIISAINHQETFAIFPTNAKLNNTDFLGLQSLDTRFDSPEGRELLTRFDVLREQSRFLRELAFAAFNPERSFRENLRLGKIQREIPANTPFPCNLNYARSITPPSTVHQLRPGDIDIIATLGDSLSAGTCLMSETFMQIFYENRGLTFTGGGYGNWRRFLTLPNILKVFNPYLYGYAIADGFTFHSTSRFNVAEPVGMSRDLLHQAKILIQRMRKDPNVDFENHWKLLTIFIGSVDYCVDLCVYDDVSVALRYHEQDLRQTLTLLRENVPRLFVNLLPAPNMIWPFRKMKLSPTCFFLHHSFCPCVTSLNRTNAELKEYERKIHLWQDVDAYIANLAEFNTMDFTVVYQPFFADPQVPLLPNGDVDLRYFGADCFHLSQLGHAAMANTLWNSMMQPVGYKERNYIKPFERFECPSLERPYLATKLNSRGLRV